MIEKTTLSLDCKKIKDILFEYYFDNLHPNVKAQIFENGRMDYQLLKKKNTVIVNFILRYNIEFESLSSCISKEIIVSEEDFNNIINEKISNAGYEIDTLEKNIVYALDEGNDNRLGFLTYKLKKKEQEKIKKYRR